MGLKREEANMQCYEKWILVVETFKQKDKVSPKMSKQNYDNQQHNNNNGKITTIMATIVIMTKKLMIGSR